MDRVINLQMSLFGNYVNIKPQTDIVIKLLTALQEHQFIPGSAEMVSFDLPSGKMVVDSRMQLVSPDRTWTIVFLVDRIDFNYTYQNGTKSYQNINELVQYGKTIIEKVFSVFPDTTGNRLALNCRFVRENITNDDLNQFRGRFTKEINTFKSDNYVEWTIRYNNREKMVVGTDNEELCNRIVEISQVERLDESKQPTIALHDVVVMLDVNTSATDISQRFKYSNLLYFAENAKSFIGEAISEIEGN